VLKGKTRAGRAVAVKVVFH